MIVPKNEAVSFRHEISLINKTETESNGCKEICLNVNEHSEGHFTHWEKRTTFFQNKRIYTDFCWIFLENKRIFAKGVRDFWE